MLTAFAINFPIALLTLGDASTAAIIAAISSVVNGLMLLHNRKIQGEIKDDVKALHTDTGERDRQIEELRSLSIERMRHILALERVIDRLEAIQFDLQQRAKRIRKGDRLSADSPIE